MIATCPPDETLRRYLLGDFSDGEGSELETHLAECSACEETLSRFDDTHDSLLRHLPLAAGSSVGDESKTSGWLQRLMQGPPQPPEDDQPGEEPTAGLVIEGLENYELTGVLGKGGMGVVYRARHRQLNRPVAIKVIRPKLFSAAEARQRFAREIQILGGLNHPGIVAATDAGKIGPAAYLVMELIDGVDFSRLVHRSGPLAIGEACEVARQIAAALAAVHSAGAIHRDIKPSNVMLDRAGRVKLLDFGLAHLAEPERDHPETSMGRLLGTLDYMAPEQADGDTVGTAADLYAIGATLYFLLTGRPPRGGEGQQTLLQQLKNLVQNEITPLTAARADVPPQLSELVEQLLAKDPADRPRSAQEVAQRLAAWADRESVEQLCDRVPPTAEPEAGASASQSISQSLTELLGSQLAAQVEPHIEPAPEAPLPLPKSRLRRVGGTLIALAALVAALWAGFTLLIETPSGTIRIESDVAGVQVELLDEQEHTKTLEIKQGENRSELKAGRYRILIAGGHDHLSVTPDEITLQRGEERVARITQVAAEGEVAQTDTKGQTLYQGEPLSVWEQRFRNEADPLAKIEAGKALVLLARSLPPEERFARIMWVGGQLVRDGWNTPSLKLRSMRDVSLPDNYLPPTSWPTDARRTAGSAFVVLRSMSASQLAAEEPVALAERLRAHFAQAELNEAWFVVDLLGYTALEGHFRRRQPAVDVILGRLLHPEDKDLNRVALLRSAKFFSHGSASAQADYARMLSIMGKKLAEEGLPAEEAWVAESWSNAAQVAGVEPKIRAEVAFRQLIDHGTAPTTFDLAQDDNRSDLPAAIEMAEHWIHLTNRWLEEHKAQPDSERLANVVNALTAPLRIRPIQSKWEIDRTKELAAALLQDLYKTQPGRRNPGLEPHQLLTQIILCGGEIPDFAKQPPSGGELHQRLEAFRRIAEGPALRPEQNATLGVMLDAPFTTMEVLTAPVQSPQTRRTSREYEFKIRAAGTLKNNRGQDIQSRMTRSWRQVDSLLILAILEQLIGQSKDRDDEIALLFQEHLHFSAIYPPVSVDLQSEFATRPIAEQYLRAIKQKTESENLLAAIEKLAPELKASPEPEEAPKDEPAMDPGEKPAPQPAEVDHSGPEALYQGEPVSVWQRRFEAEVNPVSKIEAAKAMFALASRLPPEEQLDRMVKIGGELLREGWGDAAVRTPLGFYLRDKYPPTRWSVTTYPTVMDDFQSLISLVNAQIDPDHLIRHLTEHVAKSEPHEAAFAMLPLIGTSGSLPPENQRVPRRITAQLGYSPWIPNQEAADIIAARLRREDLPALHSAALLFRLRRSHIASEEARKFVIDDMQSAGRRLTEQGIEDDPRELRFAQEWIQGAKDLQLDSRLVTEVEARVQFQMLLEKDVMPKGLDTPGIIHERHSHYERMKRNVQFDVPDLGHWIGLTNRWLSEHADDADPERLGRVLEALTHVLQMRPSGEVGDVAETARLLERRLADHYQRLAQNPEKDLAAESKDSDYLPHDLLAAIVLCGAEIPETAKNPPLSDQARDGLEVVRRIADRSMPREEILEILRWRGRFFMQYTYPGIKAIVEGDSKILPLIDILVSASRPVDDPQRPEARFFTPPIEPVLLLAILTDLTGISEDMDERIAESLTPPEDESRGSQFAESVLTRTLSFHMRRDLPLATNEIVERHLRQMHQKANSEKLREAIEKLVPGLEDAPEAEETPKDQPAMDSGDKPAPQPAEVDHSGPEALYQGEPVSVWERRFEAETDPLAKIEAGKALVSLTQALPASEKFDRIMSIGGELLEDGWGPEAAMEQIVTYQAIGFFGPERYNKLVAKRWPPGSAEELKESWDRLRAGGRGRGWGLIGDQLSTIPSRELAAMLVERVAQGENLEPHFALLIERGGYARARIQGDQAATDLVLRGLRPGDGKGILSRHLYDAALLARSDYYSSASAEAQAEFLSEMAQQAKRMIEPEYLPFSKLSFDIWRIRANELKLDTRLLTEVVLAGLLGGQHIVPSEFSGEIADPANHRLKFQRAPRRDDFLFHHWGPVVTDWIRRQQEAENKSEEDRRLYRENLARVLPTLETVLQARLPSDDWNPEPLGQLLSELMRDRLEGGDIVPSEISTASLLTSIVLCDVDLPEIVKQPPLPAEVQKRLELLRQFVTTETTGEQYDRRMSEFAGVFQEAPYPTLQILLEGDQHPAGRGLSHLLEVSARPDLRTRPRQFPNQVSWVEPSLLLAIAADLAGTSEAQDDRIVETLLPARSRGELELGNTGLAIHLYRRLASDFAVRQITERHLSKMRQKTKSEKLREAIDKLAPGLEETPEADPQVEPAMDAVEKPAPKPGEVDHSGPEPLYQGEPLAVWQRRFEAETDPLAKIEAGKALVSLARALPDEERFSRIMWVGGQLVAEGWNTPALKLRSMRDANIPEGNRPQTSWPDDEDQTIFKEYPVFRNLAISQVVAEEPMSLAKRLTDHVAQGEPDEAWFAIKIFFHTAFEAHLHPSQPAIDWIVSRLRRPEDKDLNRVILLRYWRLHSMASEEIREQYAQELISLGEEFLTAGLPSDQAWLGASWERTARFVGISPQFRAEVAFRQLIDHGIAPTVFNFALVVRDRADFDATTQMAGHWIQRTNRWLEDHQDQPEAERLANVIDALTYPLQIRPADSEWEVDRTAEQLTELLKARYADQAGSGQDGDGQTGDGQAKLEPLQLLAQIILCGADLPEVAKNPPPSANFRKRLEAIRKSIDEPTPPSRVEVLRNLRQGIAPDYPYPAIKSILEGDKRISQLIDGLVARLGEISGPRQSDDRKIPSQLDPVLLLAILTDLTSTSENADKRIAEFLEVSRRGGGEDARTFANFISYHIRSSSQASPKAISEIVAGHLSKMRQKTKNEKLRAAIEKLAPGLKDEEETDYGELPAETEEGSSADLVK